MSIQWISIKDAWPVQKYEFLIWHPKSEAFDVGYFRGTLKYTHRDDKVFDVMIWNVAGGQINENGAFIDDEGKYTSVVISHWAYEVPGPVEGKEDGT